MNNKPSIPFAEVKARAMENPEVKKEYDRLKAEEENKEGGITIETINIRKAQRN
jgi:hypothetical protein